MGEVYIITGIIMYFLLVLAAHLDRRKVMRDKIIIGGEIRG